MKDQYSSTKSDACLPLYYFCTSLSTIKILNRKFSRDHGIKLLNEVWCKVTPTLNLSLTQRVNYDSRSPCICSYVNFIWIKSFSGTKRVYTCTCSDSSCVSCKFYVVNCLFVQWKLILKNRVPCLWLHHFCILLRLWPRNTIDAMAPISALSKTTSLAAVIFMISP